MADFIIPKGSNYPFTVRVFQQNSYTPQDLTNATAELTIFDIADQCLKSTVTLTVLDALNGVLSGVIPDTDTINLVVNRGDAVDGYYLKAGYQGSIAITLPSDPDLVVLIDKVYVTPSAIVCA